MKLLKLDCEGAEHEMLADCGGWRDRVDHWRGEIHLIPVLSALGYTVEGTGGIIPDTQWQIAGGEEVTTVRNGEPTNDRRDRADDQGA